MKPLLILIATNLLLFSCSDEPSNFNVSGFVYYDNIPKSDVKVSIDSILNWTVKTDINGYYNIDGVSEGSHSINIKTALEDGSFIERSSKIIVNDNLELNPLILPKAVKLFDPIEITSSSISLKWSSSNADDFREYKVYRHNSAGLDETSGTLIYVTTNYKDTLFKDESLEPITTCFYRIYTMNDYGKLGGSNIISGLTNNQNLFWNGNFENNEDLMTWWDESLGTISIADSTKVSDTYSLFINARIDWDPRNALPVYGYLKKHLYGGNAVKLLPGRHYKLHGWIKTEGECGYEWIYGTSGFKARVIVSFDDYPMYMIGLGKNTDWTYLETDFYVPSQSYHDGYLALMSVSQKTWYDDIKLELIDD